MKCFLTLCLSFFLLSCVYAQSPDSSDSDFSPQFGFSTSYSPKSFNSWGTMENTSIFFFEMQYTHSKIEQPFTVHFSSDLILTGWLHFPVDGKNGPKESRFGFGFSPFQIDLPFHRGTHYPFLTSSAGLLITNQAFPNGDGTRLNFLLDAGLGYSFSLPDHQILQLGYKLHHLSNGNTASLNPGIDSHMFFIKLLYSL